MVVTWPVNDLLLNFFFLENKYFEILLANGVYFYREEAKVKTFTVKKPTEEINETTKKPETEEAKTIVSGGGGGSY